jgi:hypothetical protein
LIEQKKDFSRKDLEKVQISFLKCENERFWENVENKNSVFK